MWQPCVEIEDNSIKFSIASLCLKCRITELPGRGWYALCRWFYEVCMSLTPEVQRYGVLNAAMWSNMQSSISTWDCNIQRLHCSGKQYSLTKWLFQGLKAYTSTSTKWAISQSILCSILGPITYWHLSIKLFRNMLVPTAAMIKSHLGTWEYKVTYWVARANIKINLQILKSSWILKQPHIKANFQNVYCRQTTPRSIT